MRTLFLKEGDLLISHRDYVTVTGVGKVMQDLRGALLEPLGNDRFHPGYGSELDTFIAGLVSPETRYQIEGEVNRVLANYAAIQRDKIEADITSNADTRFSTDEILDRVTGVTVTTSTESIGVTIGLRTVSGEVVVLTEAVL